MNSKETGREKIVKILMERDGMTRREAESTLSYVLEMMIDCNYDDVECEEIFMDELGLEPDYMIELFY